MKIDELLDKYFEGETSCEEERRLRRFFTEEEKGAGNICWFTAPLFVYLDKEAVSVTRKEAVSTITPKEKQQEQPSGKPSRFYRMCYAISGVAAGLLLLLGVAKTIFPLSGVLENYVVIDGKRYTDEKLVEAKALEALQHAGFTEEDLNNLLFQH